MLVVCSVFEEKCALLLLWLQHAKQRYLSVQSGARVVGGHAMVGHLAPRVVLRGRLGTPHIPSIACSHMQHEEHIHNTSHRTQIKK